MIDFVSADFTDPQVDEAVAVAAPILEKLNIAEQIVLQKRQLGSTGEFHCRYIAGKLIISGDAEGVRCGLYRVLQKLGVRHFSPREDIMIPPQSDLPSLAALHDFAERPSFAYRGLHICGVPNQFDDAVGRWMSFNGMNRKLTHIPQLKAIGARLAALGLKPDTTVHSYELFIPDGKYFSIHPEWFPLIGGKRIRQADGGQLCLSNRAMRTEFVNSVISFADKNPGATPIGICPNDGFGWCECHECRALDSSADRQNGKFNARVADFVEDVARQIAAKRPELLLGHYSYSVFADFADYLNAPPANLVVSLTAFHCYKHDFADPSCPVNQKLEKRRKSLHAKLPNLYIYDYYTYGWDGMPAPVAAVVSADFKGWHRSGMHGFMTEVSGMDNPSWESYRTAFYTMAVNMWNADRPITDIRRDYCARRYGKAAGIMEKFFILQEKSLADMPGCFLKKASDFEKILTPATQRAGELLLNEAQKLAPGNPLLASEVKLWNMWCQNAVERKKYHSATTVKSHPLAAFVDAAKFHPAAIHLVNFSDQLPDKRNSSAVMVGSDNDFLTLRLRMTETEPAKILFPKSNRMIDIYNSDSIELFFADGVNPQVCYHFLIAPDGQFAASRCEGSSWDWTWQNSARVTAKRNPNGWQIDFTMRKKDLNEKTDFRFSIIRNRRCGKELKIYGTPDGGAFFDTAKYITVK